MVRVIEIIDGVARLVNEDHCDGLGACIGDCPNSAISLVTVVYEPAPAKAADGDPADGSGGRHTRVCPLWSISLDSVSTDAGG